MTDEEGTETMQRLLICTDLDRTLLPNGLQPESPRARERFRAVAARPEVELAYVSGRDLGLVERAIEEYQIPQPDYLIGDVGTCIYTHDGSGWGIWDEWSQEIGRDWPGREARDLRPLFDDIPALELQEEGKQGRYKLSYYADPAHDIEGLLAEMRRRLELSGVAANLIWSVDETSGTGLIDLLPERASKLHAVRFLIAATGHQPHRTLFAGDSGNDLAVLASGIPSVLVANATAEVRTAAQWEVAARGKRGRLYYARGGFRGMNGNYSAGILEGLAYFFREAEAWIP